MEILTSFIGILVFIGFCFLISENRKAVSFRIIVWGLCLQFLMAVIVIKTTFGKYIFHQAKLGVDAIISLSDVGAKFVFGHLIENIFAFHVLPTIIFVSALSAALFYYGVVQKVVQALAFVMQKTMGISGTESLVTAANIFFGQTEAPLIIKPYLKFMTRSELLLMMTSGMATVAGGVLAAFAGMGIDAGHLLAASLMSAPASVMIAKIMLPEAELSPTADQVKINIDIDDVNVFAAVCRGAKDGLFLALNVAAMLIAVIAIVSMVDLLLSSLGSFVGYEISLRIIFSYLFFPVAFLIGIPLGECGIVAQFLGEKIVLNEFVAYIHLGEVIKEGTLSERSIVLSTYALCGFANFSSMAIQIGGIGDLVPEQRNSLARLAFRAMVGGSLAAFTTACVAGLLI